jgi:hypothetical protein
VLFFLRFFLHFDSSTKRHVKRREENKKKNNNNERVKEREIPGGGKTFIIFDLSTANQKRFAIQFERQLCAQEQRQH